MKRLCFGDRFRYFLWLKITSGSWLDLLQDTYCSVSKYAKDKEHCAMISFNRKVSTIWTAYITRYRWKTFPEQILTTEVIHPRHTSMSSLPYQFYQQEEDKDLIAKRAQWLKQCCFEYFFKNIISNTGHNVLLAEHVTIKYKSKHLSTTFHWLRNID